MTRAQRYALEYWAAFEDGVAGPRKRWDAKQCPRSDVMQKLRDMGLIEGYSPPRPTISGRAAIRDVEAER